MQNPFSIFTEFYISSLIMHDVVGFASRRAAFERASSSISVNGVRRSDK